MSSPDDALQKAARDLFARARGDAQRLALLAAQFQQATKGPNRGRIVSERLS